MAVLGLRFCARAFSSCGKRGPFFIAVRGPLTIAASLLPEHRLQTRRLSNCGSRAQSLRGMWDLPRPGLEPASPALAGRFSTTAPPGKPGNMVFKGTNIGSWWAKNILDISVDYGPPKLNPTQQHKEIYSISVMLKFHRGGDGLVRKKYLNRLLRGWYWKKGWAPFLKQMTLDRSFQLFVP